MPDVSMFAEQVVDSEHPRNAQFRANAGPRAAILPTPAPAPAPAGEAARRPADEQLERILRSETFQLSDRLKRFLMFIVRETAAGRGGELKA
jgi:hypothetical protein